MSGVGGNYYDENDAEEILRLAARDGGSGRVDKEKLLAMAAELGIPPEAVARAERELVAKKEIDAEAEAEKRDREEFRRRRTRNLVAGASSWLTLSALMVGIWFLSGRGDFWPAWIIFFGAFGFLPGVFHRFGGSSEDEFQRWRRRKQGLIDTPRQGKVRDVLNELASRQDMGRLEVIRELRVRTGLPLSDAKQAVEIYASEHDGIVW